MQELVGRLTALDPEASETLKVVAYFDVLVAGGVGIQALVGGAAVLGGTVAGASVGRRTHRIGPDGDRRDESAQVRPDWPSRSTISGTVWLEREGPRHANDDMIIERLALAIDLVEARRPGELGSSLEIAIDATRDVEERRVALSRLRINPSRDIRVAVLPLSHETAAAPSTVVATPYGLLRAVVLGQDTKISGPAGVGLMQRADQLPESFRTAVLALRLLPERTSASTSVLDAADLGILLAAVSALEPVAARQPDAVALARLSARTREVLDELAASESVRAAATALGMHHSTLQARHDALTNQLGYDPRSLHGRARFQLARLLLRLVDEY